MIDSQENSIGQPFDIYSLHVVQEQMKSAGSNALVCPYTGLVYPVLHGVPVVFMDDTLRENSFYVAKRMEADGMFEKHLPAPNRFPAVKQRIFYMAGLGKLVRYQLGTVIRQTPRALVRRLLKKIIGLPSRRSLENVQTGYEAWDQDRIYANPNTLYLGIEEGHFFEWNASCIRDRVVAEVVETAQACSAKRILDVGCGYGQILLELAEALAGRQLDVQLYGLDMTYSRVALSHRMHRQHNAHGRPLFFAADSRFIPYPDDYFDIGYTNHVFEVMPPKVLEHAMLEMLRVCKQVILLEPLLSTQSAFGRLYNFVFDIGGAYIDFLDREKYAIDTERLNLNYTNNSEIIRISKHMQPVLEKI